MADIPPNNTLYIQNINQRLSKAKLKKNLYELFGEHGAILDVVALRTEKMRGQAFVVFDDVASASKAMRELQGFAFFGKPLRIYYAKTKSDAIAKRDGTYVPRMRNESDEDGSEDDDRGSDAEMEVSGSESHVQAHNQQSSHTEETLPNKILFVQNLPHQTTEDMVVTVFGQFAGFHEVRMIPSKPGIAFVEFSDEYTAGRAREELQGFNFTPTNTLRVSYAKR